MHVLSDDERWFEECEGRTREEDRQTRLEARGGFRSLVEAHAVGGADQLGRRRELDGEQSVIGSGFLRGGERSGAKADALATIGARKRRSGEDGGGTQTTAIDLSHTPRSGTGDPSRSLPNSPASLLPPPRQGLL